MIKDFRVHGGIHVAVTFIVWFSLQHLRLCSYKLQPRFILIPIFFFVDAKPINEHQQQQQQTVIS